MKKYYKSKKIISYNKRHRRKQEEKKLRYKFYKKRVNYEKNRPVFANDELDRNHIVYKKAEWDYELSVPTSFSLTNNREETIGFIQNVDKVFHKKKTLFINLKDVTNIDYETILLLLASTIKFKTANINLGGNYPDDAITRERLHKSKFFEVLLGKKQYISSPNFSLDGNGIFTHAKEKVDSELSFELIKVASKSIWGDERYCKGVQRTLIELMQNTNNHAGKKPGEKSWWLSVNCIEDENRVIFSFFDFGQGIFNSLKNNRGRFERWFAEHKQLFPWHTNAEVLDLILKGEMHETATGQKNRGKGLPGIYEAFVDNAMSRLCIISNDVYADISSNEFLKMDTKLNGTFVFWELNQQNTSNVIINEE